MPATATISPVVAEPAADEPRAPFRRRTTVALDVGVPVLIRLVEMVAQAAAVGLLDRGSGHSLLSRFTIWDAQLYRQLAQHGYPHHVVVGPDHTLLAGGGLAFSPLYPATVGLAARAGLGLSAAELAVSIAAGCLASVLIHALVRARGGRRRTGYLACVLIGVLPMAVVLQMGYAEALYAAAAAGALLAATRGRWWLAGGLALLAGATRPTGYVVVAGVVATGLVARARAPDGAPRPSRRCLAAVAALGLSSTVAFWGFVAARDRHLTGWFRIEEEGWGTHLDGGVASSKFLWSSVTHPAGPAVIVTLILVGAAIGLPLLAARDNWPYVVMGALTLASIALSSDFWHTEPRLLLAAGVLVVPAAEQLQTVSARRILILVAAGFAASAWFGAYLLTQWPYTI